MSTRIYDGMRVKTEDLPEFFDVFHDLAVGHAAAKLEEYATPNGKGHGLDELKRRVVAMLEAGSMTEQFEPMAERDWRLLFVVQLAREASASMETDMFCMDAAVNVFLLGKHALVCPYVPRGLKVDEQVNRAVGRKMVERYGYWDNTDREEGVSNAEWQARKADWGKVVDEDGEWDRKRLEHVVLELKNRDRSLRDLEKLFRALYQGDKDKALRMAFMSHRMGREWKKPERVPGICELEI